VAGHRRRHGTERPGSQDNDHRHPGALRGQQLTGDPEELTQGAGVGLSPAWLVSDLIESGQLVRVLPDWSGTLHEAFLLYPSRRYQPLRARVFL
jgi:DNA-binding transcriptional LysR family regulator